MSLNLIENYIYFYHLQEYCVLPQYPEQISDSNSASFSETTILGRSAPIQTYGSSGPRVVGLSFAFHRDLMNSVSLASSTLKLNDNEDIVDALARTLHSAVLPRYIDATKMVNPPIVALRIGNDIFIKGVIKDSVSITKTGPILADNKYAVIKASFSITEINPYDAVTSKLAGSFRGLDVSLEKSMRK